MKKQIFRLVCVTLLLTFSSTAVLADGSAPQPTCFPGDKGCPMGYLTGGK